MKVAFFGHSDATESIRADLKIKTENMITQCNAESFLVGHQGRFDSIALGVLRELKVKYPHIKITVVSAYMPKQNENYGADVETVYPEIVALSPRKFAISKRNDWIITQSDCIIAYVTRSVGGAASFCEKAKKKGKEIFNIGNVVF